MNPKYRALLWEECRVGGSLALACLAVGMTGLAAVYYGVATGQMRWNDADSYVFFSVFGAPLLLCLVLTSQTTNSGQLSIEFSPRILRLPVGTRTLTGLLLFSRLAMVMAVAGMLSSACLGLLGHGVLPTWFLLAGLAYLYVQSMAWLYRPAPSITFLGYSLLGLAIIVLAGPASASLKHGLPTQLTQFLPAILVLFVGLAIAYGTSVWAVDATRRGARIGWRLRMERPTALPWPGFLRPKQFSTPFAAQLWWELRTNAFWLPLFALIGFGLLAGVWILTDLMTREKPEDTSPFMLNLFFEWGPLVALILAGTTCAGMRSGTHISSKPVTSLFPFVRPLTSAEMASAQLTAHALSLAFTLLAVTAISTGWFLLTSDAANWHLLSNLSSSGIMSPREIARYLFGVSVLCGLFAWALGESRTAAAMFIFIAVGPMIELIPGVLRTTPENESAGWDLANPRVWYLVALVLWIPVGIAIVGTLRCLNKIRKRNLFPPHHRFYCLSVWAAAALFFFPFAYRGEFPSVLAQIALSVALGAVVILPYPALILSIQRSRHDKNAGMNANGHRRHAHNWPLGFRMAAGAGLALTVATLAWFRWPETLGYEKFLKSHGWPVNSEDLEALYPPVPPERNLALRYLEIGEQLCEKEEAYISSLVAEDMRRPKPTMEDPLDQVLLRGKAEVEPGNPIPESVWNATHAYYNAVARETANQLKKTAQSGLTESRYPVSFDPESLSDYSSPENPVPLRSLCRTLELESLVALFENRPGDAVVALLAMLPVANSLANEPILLSQYVRRDLLRNWADAFKKFVNCTQVAAPELAQLRMAFSQAFLSGEEAIETGLKGECVAAFYRLDWLSRAGGEPNRLSLPFKEQFWDFTGSWSFMGSEIVRRVFARAGILDFSPNTNEDWSNTGISGMSMFFALPFPSDDKFGTEMSCQARLGQAVLACAVEEFRIAHGALPDTLHALVPEFLAEVPEDPVNNGKPLSYKILPNGGYTIYSVGMDRVDDGGVAKKDNGWREGDLAFTVAPPAQRHPPRIAREGSAL